MHVQYAARSGHSLCSQLFHKSLLCIFHVPASDLDVERQETLFLIFWHCCCSGLMSSANFSQHQELSETFQQKLKISHVSKQRHPQTYTLSLLTGRITGIVPVCLDQWSQFLFASSVLRFPKWKLKQKIHWQGKNCPWQVLPCPMEMM